MYTLNFKAFFLTDLNFVLKLYVWIDPLDGTREYTQGADVSKECTVLIGISWNGKPIAGVINQPFYPYLNYNSDLGRHLWGIVGLGT